MSEPLAYFITFHTYGSWLHGEKKGSVDEQHNRFDTPFISRNDNLRQFCEEQLSHSTQILDSTKRNMIDKTIREVANYRGWTIHALNVRTNHVHVVVAAVDTPEKVLHSFKSYCTRRLREANVMGKDEKLWSRHGSTRYLWDEKSVDDACKYVVEGQGMDLS